MKKALLLATSTIVAVVWLGGAAFAATDADQPQAAKPNSSSDDATQVDSVIVQVNKRNEKIEDAPVAVTAFTPQQRDELGVISIFDMTRATPSFEYSSAIDRAFIRGVGRNTNAPGTQAGVALYIDGVYTPLTYGLDRAVILSGNVETDAGPQGTLFGRNAIGGVIQQTTAHATDQFQVRTDLRYQDHNRFDGAVTVAGPINDHLKLLIGADYRKQTQGYFKNLFLHKDSGGPTDEALYVGVADYSFGNFEGFVKLEANTYNRKLSQFSQYGATYSALSPYFNDYTYTNQISVTGAFNCGTVDPATAGSLLTVRALVSCPANVAQAVSYYDPTNVTAQNPFLIKQDYRTQFKSRSNWDTVAQTTWHLPWFDLKYIGGYTQYVYDNHQDYDNTARGAWQVDPDGPANPQPATTIRPTVYNYYENRKWSSHELDFQSTGKGPISWIYGLYYYHDDFLNTTHINAPGQTELGTVVDAFTGLPAVGINNSNLDYYNTSGHAITDSYATFGQVDYRFNDKWTLTGGLRWNRDTVETTEEDHYISWVPGVTAPFNAATGKYGSAVNYTPFIVQGSCTPANVPAITASGASCSFDPVRNIRKIGDSWDGAGGVMTLSYKPNAGSLAYFKYSRGYKAGGIAISGAMSVQPVMKPENLNAYELGYKFSPSRTITINADIFYYDYRNYQDFGSIPNTFGGTAGLISVGFNVPKARNIGFEATGAWHPTHAFTLTFSGNYMDAKVIDGGTVSLPDTLDPGATGTVKLQSQNGSTRTLTYTPSPCGAAIVAAGVRYQPQCITGDVLKGSSPWKIWLSPQYRLDFQKGSLDLVANYSIRAGNVSSYTKDPLYKAPNYSEVDVRAVWQSSGSRYQVIGFVNNVFDKAGTEFVLAGRTTLGNDYVEDVLTIPRTWGLELQTKF